MKKITLFFFFVFNFCFSQQRFIDSVISPLQKDQLLFEKVFIHTNKTIYFDDDIIWFKAYVGKNTNEPSLNTTLLYVNLFDENKNLIFNNTILIHNGVGQGQFELKEQLQGEYYIQAYTNYMRNFGEDNFYFQKIQIIKGVNSILKQTNSKNKYDVQIFPEGGYLLENVENTIGIKSVINGKGFSFSGKIIDSKNKEITKFKNEHLGMTKCNFVYKENEKYHAEIIINDTIIKVEIPKARKKGVVLKIDNRDNSFVKINFQTNDLTLQTPKNKYRLLFHQRNQLIDFMEISNLNSDLEIDKKEFYRGVNTVTLFEENEPIAERKFFVEKEDQKVSLSIQKMNLENNSITYKVKVLDNFLNPLKANLSVSILPIDALNFKESVNIKSAFLLSPYVKGYIENSSNYFNQKNQKREEQLDLLLLTQGWTEYSRQEMIGNLNPKPKYNFEQGIKLKGTASPLLSSHLALMTKKGVLIDKLFLKGEKEFSFDKLLLYKGDSIAVSFLRNNNEAIKPKDIFIDTAEVRVHLKLSYNLAKGRLVKKQDNNNSLSEFNRYKGTRLDEVQVKGKKRSEKQITRGEFIKNNKSIVLDIGKYYQVEIDKNDEYADDLMSYLQKHENVSIVNWRGLENYLSIPGGEAILVIDGKRVHSNELNGVYVKMNEIESVGVKTVRLNKIYQVFTTKNYKNNVEELFKGYVINNGYDKSKKYYTPIYDFNLSKKWKEIDWKPELKTNELGIVYFKIKKNKIQENNIFSVNGFSKSGILINTFLKNNQ